MTDASVSETGHRLNRITWKAMGEHAVLDLELEDRKTKEPVPKIRFFTGYAGLGLLARDLIHAQQSLASQVLKAGKLDVLEQYTLSTVTPASASRADVGADRKSVTVLIECEQGPSLVYAMPAKQALALADQLRDAAVEVG